MTKVAANADDYAVARQNVFFTANSSPASAADGDLTGQCVTLEKWFTAEVCDNFPSPFIGRGDARYVGKNLVAAGLAVEVPYDQRRRGDIVCLEYGTYGHIYVQLSGGRVFEENVNLGGVARKLVDGAYVYASRIASDQEPWRIAAGKNPHVYRLKSYIEGNTDMPITKEMEMSEAYKATGSYPGDGYSYPFVGTTDYNGMLTFWQGQMRLISADTERSLADKLASLKAGRTITGYIGADYNSPFVGQPEVYFQKSMEEQWITYVSNDKNLVPDTGGSATVLKPGNYKVS